jgi:lysophospholipase L1-like esterase
MARVATRVIDIVVIATLVFATACSGPSTPAPSSAASDGPTVGSTDGASGAPVNGRPLRYVALGDSYTIGTSVAIEARWPNQLEARLRDFVRPLDLVANLGVNGYTSRDVLDLELPQLDALDPEIVSLLVGVNDVVQGASEERFRANAALILDDLVARVGATWIFVVSTPDYTVTPAGADYGDPVTQSAAVRRNNAILEELARGRAIAFVDIYELSLEAANDRSLVADDGLHPSGRQYARWIDEIAPYVEDLIAP